MADLTQIVITAQDRTQAAFGSVGARLDALKGSTVAIASSMAALAGAVSVGAIAAWAEDVIAAASALDDLADATGSTVESLSKLSNIAKVSGADFATIDAAIKKLAVGMAGVDEESSKAGKALALLGIQARDPAEALQEVALSFAKFADGPEKAALAVQIFGKAGANLLPILKDIAANQDIASTVTTKQAADAELLEKAWRRLGIEGNTLKNVLLSEIVPALTTIVTSFNEARKAGMGFFEALKNTGNYDLIGTQKQLMDLETQISKAEQSVAKYIERGDKGLASQLQPKIEEMKRQAALLQSVVNQLVSKLPDRVPAADLPKAPVLEAKAAAAKKVADTSREAAAAVREWKEQEDALADAASRYSKIQDDLAKGISAMQADLAAYVDKQSEAVRQYDEQTRAIGATEQELNALELARQAEIRDMRLLAGWGEDAIRIYDEWAAAIGRRNAKLTDDAGRAAEKKFAEDWARTAERIGDGLTDAFMRAAESGRDFFKSLASDLTRMFSQLVLRPIVQGVLAPLAGGITSSLYGGGASASGLGSGGMGSYLQTGQSLFNLGGASASAYGAGVGFATSGVGSSLGLSAAFTDVAAGGAFATSSVMTGAGTALAGLAAAAPYIAAVVAIAYALYEAFGQQPGAPKLGGYAAAGDIMPWNRTDQFTNGGFQPGHFTPDQMDAALQPVVSEWVKGTAATIKALGGSAVGIGFDLGIDKDPGGDAANRLGIRANVNGKQVYNYFSGDDALGRDDATLQAAIELESKRALVAALQASDLPASIAAVFDTAVPESMTAGAIDNLMAFGAAMKLIIDTISGDVLTDATKVWTDAQKDSSDRLRDMGDEVVRLANEMDGSTASMQALASASLTYRNAVVQVLVAIRQVAQQAQAMQASLVQTIQTDGMDQFSAFNFWTAFANQQALGLGSATSAEDVGAIADSVYSAVGTAFAALPEDVREAYKPALLEFLSEFGSGVEQALTNVRNATVAGTESPFAAAQSALDGAAGKFDQASGSMQSASATQLQAAQISLDAANINLQAANTPLVVRLAGSEVNG